jgi:hypothetical protein
MQSREMHACEMHAWKIHARLGDANIIPAVRLCPGPLKRAMWFESAGWRFSGSRGWYHFHAIQSFRLQMLQAKWVGLLAAGTVGI